jgi:alpha-glucuronidase
MNWGSSPLEIRAYVQKGKSAQWHVLDIIGKREIFSKGSIYDKHSETLTTIWNKTSFGDAVDVIGKLTHAALRVSELLDYYMPNLGCCCIDFMISTEGDPYLIGVGGFEQNDYLYQLDNKSSWITYIHNIFLYLLFLKKKMEKGATHELD